MTRAVARESAKNLVDMLNQEKPQDQNEELVKSLKSFNAYLREQINGLEREIAKDPDNELYQVLIFGGKPGDMRAAFERRNEKLKANTEKWAKTVEEWEQNANQIP